LVQVTPASPEEELPEDEPEDDEVPDDASPEEEVLVEPLDPPDDELPEDEGLEDEVPDDEAPDEALDGELPEDMAASMDPASLLPGLLPPLEQATTRPTVRESARRFMMASLPRVSHDLEIDGGPYQGRDHDRDHPIPTPDHDPFVRTTTSRGPSDTDPDTFVPVKMSVNTPSGSATSRDSAP
jgi:hypothetical protein